VAGVERTLSMEGWASVSGVSTRSIKAPRSAGASDFLVLAERFSVCQSQCLKSVSRWSEAAMVVDGHGECLFTLRSEFGLT
jgi:hypothetical protein